MFSVCDKVDFFLFFQISMSAFVDSTADQRDKNETLAEELVEKETLVVVTDKESGFK